MAGLLTWKRARTYSAGLALFYLAAWAYFSVGVAGPLNRAGEPIGGDYIAFHTAGRMLLEGRPGQLYDQQAVRAIQTNSLAGAPNVYDPLRNPPFFAALFAPLAVLDLIPSFAAWTALSAAFLATAVWLALGMVNLRSRWPAVACIVFGFAPVYLGLIGGQNSTLALLLYVLTYRALSRGHDGHAGAWAAFGLFKPQLFLLFPLLFLVARRWRALSVYIGIAALLGLASVALVGVDGIMGWIRILFLDDMEAGITFHHGSRMHSLKSFFDLLLPHAAAVALALSVIASVALTVPVLRLAAVTSTWNADGLPLLYALVCVVSVLVDPHMFDYDLTVLVIVAIIVGTLESHAKWWFLGFYALLFLREPVPVGDIQIQLTVPILVAFAIWLAKRIISREPQARSQILLA